MSEGTKHAVGALWQPTQQWIHETALFRFRGEVERRTGRAMPDYEALHAWSIAEPAAFWSLYAEFAKAGLSGTADQVISGPSLETKRWFSGVQLNYAERLLAGGPSDAPAVIALSERGTDRRLTYGELRRAVVETAIALKKLGVVPMDRVAAYACNNEATLIAYLACSAIGAIFTSADPSLGARAVADRFAEVAPKFLFASESYVLNGTFHDSQHAALDVLAEVPSIQDIIWISSKSFRPELPTAATDYEIAEFRFDRLPFDHPLCILYSSGTTGKPKAIVHRAGGALLKHMCEHQLHSDIRAGDTVFYYTNCNWMMWNWLVSALARGAAIVLYDGGVMHPDSEALWSLVPRFEVTHFGVSAFYLDFCASTQVRPAVSRSFESLRCVLSTGAPLSPRGFEWVYEAVKRDVHLASISGGTDILGCFMLGDPTGPVFAGQIQRPALGGDIAAFSDDGDSVVGVKGELVCRNALPSMPLGFWNDPEGTRFFASYFERFPGVWHHGDSIEITREGGIVVYGRSDATIKCAGVRIGTAEIYRALQDVPEVTGAIAAGKRERGDEKLWLLVVLRDGKVLDDTLERRIRTAVVERNSETHAPARIVHVPDLPRTHNGKLVELAVKRLINGEPITNLAALANPGVIDEIRRALEPCSSPTDPPSATWTPENAQRRLCAAIARLRRTKVEAIKSESLLAALGLSSLDIVELTLIISDNTGVSVRFDTFSKDLTVEALATRIGDELAKKAASSAGSVPPMTVRRASVAPPPAEGDVPLSHAQMLWWTWEERNRGTAAWNILQACSFTSVDREVLERALTTLVARHEMLRTAIVVEGGEPFQVIGEPYEVRVPVTALDEEAGSVGPALTELAQREVEIPFDFTQGPLVRFRLVELRGGQVLLLTAHHLVVDMWALRLLFGELARLYDAYVAGRPSPLAPAIGRYRDFASWQRGPVAADAFAEQVAYWREHLSGTELRPLRRHLAELRSDRVAKWTQPAEGLLASLDEIAQSEKTSSFTLAMIALSVTLSRMSGVDQVIVATPLANRLAYPSSQAIVGSFSDLALLRNDLRGNRTFRDVIARTKQNVVDAVMHEAAPISLVLDQRDPTAAPFDVVLNMPPEPESLRAAHGFTYPFGPLPTRSTHEKPYRLVADLTVLRKMTPGAFELAGNFTQPGLSVLARNLVATFEEMLANLDAPVRQS